MEKVPTAELNKMYSNQVETFKNFAAARAATRTYNAIELNRRLTKCIELVNERMSHNEPFAIGELVLAANVSRDTWDRMRKGDLDHVLYEYIAANNITDNDIYTRDGQSYIEVLDEETGEKCEILLAQCSEIIEKFYTQHEVFLELNMYNNKSMPAVTADIFALKARHKWDDKPQDSGTVTNNNLIIADKEQAQKVVELLSKG